MSNGYPDGLNQRGHDAAMGLEFSPGEYNAIQMQLEEKAEDEAMSGADCFREWLVDNVEVNGGGCIALTLTLIDRRGSDWLDRVAVARSRLLEDWVAYRVNTFTAEEVAAVARDVMEGA